MAHQIPNVRTWSKIVPPYLFAVSDLDVYVLKQHQELLVAIGRARTADRGDLPDAPIVFGNLIAPVVSVMGWVGMLRRRISDFGRLADGIAAWCFTVALADLVLVAWRWVRSRRHWNGLEVGAVVTTGVAGILPLVSMRNASGNDIFGFAPISLPVWLSVVLAALAGMGMAVASRGRRVPFRKHFRVTGPADLQRVDGLVDALEPRRREKLWEERRRAVARLRNRGLISESQGHDVLSLPLGSSPTIEG